MIQAEIIVISLLTILFMLPFALIGLFVLVRVLFMPMQKPADTSRHQQQNRAFTAGMVGY